MDDVLVHRPTLQPVEVLVQPLCIVSGTNIVAAVLAPMDRRAAADHLPPDARRGQDEIVRPA